MLAKEVWGTRCGRIFPIVRASLTKKLEGVTVAVQTAERSTSSIAPRRQQTNGNSPSSQNILFSQRPRPVVTLHSRPATIYAASSTTSTEARRDLLARRVTSAIRGPLPTRSSHEAFSPTVFDPSTRNLTRTRTHAQTHTDKPWRATRHRLGTRCQLPSSTFVWVQRRQSSTLADAPIFCRHNIKERQARIEAGQATIAAASPSLT